MSDRAAAGAADVAVLSAGAARGLVEALQARFRVETGATIAGTFNAVGTIRDLFTGSARCDVLILTQAMLGELAQRGLVDPTSIVPLGRVETGVAVRSGDPHPGIADRAALRATFGAATGLYCPDPERSTAGIHLVKVLRELGLWPEAQSRLRPSASGGIAMRALAHTTEAGIVGCTQVTEILYTPGVDLVGVLPPEFALATVYSAAISRHAAEPALARRLLTLLAGSDTRALREHGGLLAVG